MRYGVTDAFPRNSRTPRVIARLLGLRRPAPVQCVPAGERVYAVGDVHGCADLFDDLLRRIEADDAARPPAATRLILLGDLIDRGPGSAAVIARARALQDGGPWPVEVLIGNHEEAFLSVLEGRSGALRFFLKFGGVQTLYSYGLSPDAYRAMDYAEVREWVHAHVPAADREWLGTLKEQVRVGDYLFVHAGVRPGVPLDEQSPADLRWIREEFMEDPSDHGAMIVHGHTITDTPDERHNRIGLDTGAYKSGVLSAMGFEGDRRWILQAGG